MLEWPLFVELFDFESLWCCQISNVAVFIPFVPKLVKDGGHILDGSLATYQALLYTKQNLRLMTLTTLKGFRISPSSEEIRGMSK